MGLFARLKAWFSEPLITDVEIPLHIYYEPDPRGAPGYKLAVIKGATWTLLRRVAIADPNLATRLEEEIWNQFNSAEGDTPLPGPTDAEHLEALKRDALIEFIRIEVARAQQ